MKRRTYTVAAIAVSMILIVSVALAFLKHRRDIGLFPDQTKNTSTFSTTENHISVLDGRTAFIHDDWKTGIGILTVFEGDRVVLDKTDIRQCQLAQDGVYYRKYDSDLYYYSFADGVENCIQKNVQGFMLCGRKLISIENGGMIIRDPSSDRQLRIPDIICACCDEKGQCYGVDRNGTVHKIHLDSGKSDIIGDLGSMPGYPNTICAGAGKICFWSFGTGFWIVDESTGSIQTLPMWKRHGTLYLSCDNENAIVSFQAFTENGSFADEIQSDENGIWRIDLETGNLRQFNQDPLKRIVVLGDAVYGVDRKGAMRSIAIPANIAFSEQRQSPKRPDRGA